MKEIKNIVFDLGGVLLTDEDDPYLKNQKLEKLLGVPLEKIDEVWNKYWPLIEIAEIGEDEFNRRFLNDLLGKSDQETIDKVKKIWREETKSLPAYELLDSLVENYSLFGLTNTGKDWFEYRVEHFGLDKYFKEIIASCIEKVHKPNKEIFEILIAKTGVNPQETVFVDDRQKNIEASEKFGFHGIFFKNKEQLINDLENLRISL